ncbi:MAG: anaerobic glycerol-3-phosphate dehydrogenase subunit B [Desulfobacteraceae bacterium]|nr:MAG: anaerobic glycerol-3-phosphate dehydrogenase subunit B [Desulfobacteraceae bacterium]
MADLQTIKSELAIIGTGFAGIAAAVFASRNGITTSQIGVSGGILYASGYFDLMGVHPVKEQKVWNNPWDAIDALIKDVPLHPYARLSKADIRESMDQFVGFLNETGLPYKKEDDRNVSVITPIGTVKPTYCVPASMWNGVAALLDERPMLIVDFWGLKGFSAMQITEMLTQNGRANLRAVRIPFPSVDLSTDLFPERMAWSMEVEENIVKLADEIRPHLNGAQVIGLPAILGIHRTETIMSGLKDLLGCDIFEIPTIPPSITGLRIKEKAETTLPQRGVHLFSQKRVVSVKSGKNGGFVLDVGDRATGEPEHRIEADGVILASGRFLGMGLHAGRKNIQETLFDLTVFQPGDRSDWHQKDFFDSRGHEINQAGIEIDETFRPVGIDGKPVFDNLFAAGSILAHQDWIRQKCGAGLAVSTAYAAVRSFMKQVKNR